MPQPVRDDQRYLPGLDGLRAIAVAAVVAYHLGYGWAQGGLLGVGVFFTLSGYLITDILVGQWASRGRIKLGDFWLRRARRLLPALFVMLAVVTVWVTLSARTFLPGFRGNVVASVFYVSNWWFIGQHASYYARFAPPTPLDHLWSLAVEEQFYLVWPWVVLLLVFAFGYRALKKRRALPDQPGGLAGPQASYLSRGARWWMAGATLALGAVSAVLMARLFHPGYDPTRIYEGTDTRAFGLLIGAALAMVYPTRGIAAGDGRTAAGRSVPAAARWALDFAGLAGLAVIVLLVWRTNQYSDFMFRGGLELLSVATAAVVAAAVTPGSLIGRALGIGPLRWTGVRSYGIYLWHFPLIVLTVAVGAAANPASPLRALAVVAGTVAVSAASWTLIEEPIRTGFRKHLTAPAGAGKHIAKHTVKGGTVNDGPVSDGPANVGPVNDGSADDRAVGEGAGPAGGAGSGRGAGSGGRGRRTWRAWLPETPQAIAGVCLLAAAVLAAGVSASTRLAANSTPSGGRVSTTAAGGTAGGDTQAGSAASAQLSNTGAASGQGKQPAAAVPVTSAGVDPVAAGGSAAIVPALPTPPPRTSCTQVVHIGDSTSDGLVSADYEPNPANRIMARYADVGIRHSIMKVVGATSIVEALPGTPNAYQMASELLKTGYHGCWVLALGTNDTADVYVGSNIGRVQRIQKMMKLIGNQPVMWVEVSSLLSSGPYAEANMRLWNDALKKELPQHPNMRIYDWPAVAQKAWFINDGIHYTSLGYAHRATAIADALAYAFPAN
ncbi:acyltransferase [Trebonia kvetii]|uniref:Acyltransferase n=1 Tax=Trebonia kvetii TaxID=2480626 RepID=A0A6P2C026_9ACTN|nr:acyltransferase [Trebonia kvetii]